MASLSSASATDDAFSLEQAGMMKRIVAAGADHEMGGILGRDLKLEPDAGGDRAVHGAERGACADRKAFAYLLDHVGPMADIGAIGEDRIAEQHDVLAMLTRRGGACRQGQGAGTDEGAAHDGAAAGVTLKHGSISTPSSIALLTLRPDS